MSKKRLADNYLTHDNWDEDEETLEAKVIYSILQIFLI